jgi:hypothetical protein
MEDRFPITIARTVLTAWSTANAALGGATDLIVGNAAPCHGTSHYHVKDETR